MVAQSSTSPQQIRIAVSACLLGERVRYDGAEKRNGLIMMLAKKFTLIPFCPEVAIGLGVPRAPVQLVASLSGIRAQGVNDPAHDITNKLQAYAQTQCDELKACAGIIFKSRSPSCGLGSTPLFDLRGEQISKTYGLFAAPLHECLMGRPMVEESTLLSDKDIESFIARLCVWQENH